MSKSVVGFACGKGSAIGVAQFDDRLGHSWSNSMANCTNLMTGLVIELYQLDDQLGHQVRQTRWNRALFLQLVRSQTGNTAATAPMIGGLATPRVHFALPCSSNVLGQRCYFVLQSTGKPYWIANRLENENSKERFPNGPSNELFRRFSKTSV
ncbi:hypothetical protein PCANC_13213 [Puccinia coronata f. sp. avenae]|uniref:Uncharacterized protein n=1 Tax=Puccinia coronata f. sp. avenae TaxID=200324 RepID=A0A2N5V029_9BASI|nr:hypothetical protein PCANC_13213 [Puccinia coronata f. sp. avenae]